MPDDVIVDFVFVPNGAPWPADWVRRHPDYITLPAKMRGSPAFMPRMFGPSYGQPKRYTFEKSSSPSQTQLARLPNEPQLVSSNSDAQAGQPGIHVGGRSEGPSDTVGGGSESDAGTARISAHIDAPISAAPVYRHQFVSGLQSHTQVPLRDDGGRIVKNGHGEPIMMPDDEDPHFFVAAGLIVRREKGFYGAVLALENFGQGKLWDIQRVGTDKLPTKAFIDVATVNIGLYAAAAGISLDFLLWIEDFYAAYNSKFNSDTVFDSVYMHLPARNVDNTKLGYSLYNTGKIRAAAPK